MLGDPPPDLLIAVYAMCAGPDLQANHRAIARAISAAAATPSRILLTPECALTGYPSIARASTEGLDLTAIAAAEQDLHQVAQAAGVVLVLGTIGPHPDSTLPGPSRAKGIAAHDANGTPLPALSNQALICGAVPTTTRYHKRCLTPTDTHHFHGGTASQWIEVDGWRLGLAICFDLRFSDIWAELAAHHCDAVLHISHMAGPDPDPGTKAQVIPALLSVRAAEWATPIAFCNASCDDRWLDSGLWDARGLAVNTIGSGLGLLQLRHRQHYDPWYQQLRQLGLSRLGPG